MDNKDNKKVNSDTYDRGIIPAETAARKEREGDNYKQTPEPEASDGIDTTGGYTVDKEGLLNNYAVEPEIYYEVPGDARQKEEELALERAQQRKEINDTDKSGQLTTEEDERGKGVGRI